MTNWKKSRCAGPEIFLRFETDLNCSRPRFSEINVQIKRLISWLQSVICSMCNTVLHKWDHANILPSNKVFEKHGIILCWSSQIQLALSLDPQSLRMNYLDWITLFLQISESTIIDLGNGVWKSIYFHNPPPFLWKISPLNRVSVSA